MTKKIMFNDKFQLTKAVLEGRKTQTRRIVPQKELDKINMFQKEYYDATFDKLEGVELLTHYFFTEKYGNLPYHVGEVVAVAQSYEKCWMENASAFHNPYFLRGLPGWTNKMFVAARNMPHKIRITDVRVERLQDISDDDCLREGIEDKGTGKLRYSFTENVKQTTGDTISFSCNFAAAREAFAALINKVSGKDVWSQNPYVFVYDFELVK